MDLILTDNSSYNTILTRPSDNQPLYHIDTPHKFFGTRKTSINRMNGKHWAECGVVELHGMSGDVVLALGHDVKPQSEGMFR